MLVPILISFSMYMTTYGTLFLIVPFLVLPPLLQVVLVLPSLQTRSCERCYPALRKPRFECTPQNPTTWREGRGQTGGTRLRAGGTSRPLLLKAFQVWGVRSFEQCICGEIVSPARRMRVLGKSCLAISGYVRSDLRYRYVLSNRLLLKLMDQPPTDMAALLHAFPSTPPVVRRRSKELLDVIRNAVKTAPSSAVEGQETPVVAEPSEAAGPPIETDGDDLPALTPQVSQQPSLWSRNEVSLTATTSALFGDASMLSSRPHLLYSATDSSLFGSLPPSGIAKVNSLSRFQDVVKKIHSTLVIAPTVPLV
jgi:hypothetical protein